jgi:hypothetical protein
MSVTKKLIKAVESINSKEYCAKFYKTDLHFHTPASEDARGKNRYNFNPYKTKYPKRDGSQEFRESVKAIQEKILDESRVVASKIVNRFLEVGLSMVAVTDHNGIGTIWPDHESDNHLMDLAAPTWYELIDSEAGKINREKGRQVLTILPGVEISTSGIHVLAIFPPQKPRRKIHFIICDLLDEIGFKIDEWGKNPRVGEASVMGTINLIVKKGGIPIPAHIDGSDKALLKLYKINSGDMKKVFENKDLSAIEIVNPSKFIKKDKKLKKPLKDWIDTLRLEKGLPNFAYFQGSDAHDIPTVSKRLTYVKMTAPVFTGLKTSIQMPSSRVRIAELHNPEGNGLYVHGIEIKNRFFGKRVIRFNRHLNCVTGKKGAGKSFLFDLIRSAVDPEINGAKDEVILIVEKIVDSQSQYFVFHKDGRGQDIKAYGIDKHIKTVREIKPEELSNLKIMPKFYQAQRMEEYISSREKLNELLVRHFGKPTKESIQRFNNMFSIKDFLVEKKESILRVKQAEEGYGLYVNTQWRMGKEKMRDFFSLSPSMRKTALMCMIIIGSDFGPAIIDSPESHFDNEDVMNYLVPVVKKFKDFQQVIFFTNNPLLAVNTDPDNYILLESANGKFKDITQGFAIDDKDKKDKLLGILEGSLKSFQHRGKRYDA